METYEEVGLHFQHSGCRHKVELNGSRGKSPRTNWTGHQVGSRAGVDAVKRKLHFPYSESNPGRRGQRPPLKRVRYPKLRDSCNILGFHGCTLKNAVFWDVTPHHSC
jgi:hypothetical protein